MAMKISLGPLAYFWSRERTLAYYDEICDAPVDIVYLGETTCSKRRELSLEDWLDIGHKLQAAGKEVVLSTLTLTEAESELSVMKRIAENGEFAIEANDMAAIQLSRGKDFVVGPHINCYNLETVRLYHGMGAKRLVLPVELGRTTIAEFLQQRPQGLEAEILAWGNLPLAFSARCYTARYHNRGKDQCGFVCNQYPDGLPMFTQDDVAFLTLNGINTQSAKTQSLLGVLPELADAGMDVLRIQPQSQGSLEIIGAFRGLLDGAITVDEAVQKCRAFAPFGVCDGYWFEKEGLAASEKIQALEVV